MAIENSLGIYSFFNVQFRHIISCPKFSNPENKNRFFNKKKVFKVNKGAKLFTFFDEIEPHFKKKGKKRSKK